MEAILRRIFTLLTFDNTHIITGFIKQLLSSTYIPACKIYTQEYYSYLAQNQKEDPRIVESFKAPITGRAGRTINYLKNDQIFSYDITQLADEQTGTASWSESKWTGPKAAFSDSQKISCVNKTFKNTNNMYDTETHEYLGEYLRFLRDYHDINLMPLYNCFNNKIRTNIFCSFKLNSGTEVSFNSNDGGYVYYAIPVKLFSNYTIAIDSALGIEMFCTLYNSQIDQTNEQILDLAQRTYKKVACTKFNQPFLYGLLDMQYWTKESEFGKNGTLLDSTKMARADILEREQDLKLILKIPTQCKSTITILEGDYRSYNDAIYNTSAGRWQYLRNHATVDGILGLQQDYDFKPISRNQLLAFNTGTSHPFADRLVEYLVGNAITPLDEIYDNIERVQKVMEQKNEEFQLVGRWEPKMQKLIYDYMINRGQPGLTVNDSKVTTFVKKPGQHPKFGHTSSSLLFDVLGFVDRDAETCYASWEILVDKEDKDAVPALAVKDSIQSVDIYAPGQTFKSTRR